MRTVSLLLCLALAGCAAANATNGNRPAGVEPEKKQWWQDGPMTREKASSVCWMKYEQGRRDISLDKRADLVDKCIVNTLNGKPVN